MTDNSSKPRVGKKTGPKPTFSRDDVVKAALDIGIGTFTLAQVAGRIGVATSAVYRVFDSREELLNAAFDEAVRSMEWDPDESMTWEEILTGWADATWRICDAYPGIDILLLTLPTAWTHIEPLLISLVRELCRKGFTREDALMAIDFVGDTTVATHIGVSAMKQTDETGKSVLDHFTDSVSPDFPYQPDPSWLERGFLKSKMALIFESLSSRVAPTDTTC